MTDKFGRTLSVRYVVRILCGTVGLFSHRCRKNIGTGARVDGVELLIENGKNNIYCCLDYFLDFHRM